jgi:hypothetical protein
MIIKANSQFPSIQTQLELNLEQKLKLFPAQDWKNTIVDGTLDAYQEPGQILQEILDVVSPTKSPIKPPPSWESLAVEGYTIVSQILGEGQNKVRLATHKSTQRTVSEIY